MIEFVESRRGWDRGMKRFRRVRVCLLRRETESLSLYITLEGLFQLGPQFHQPSVVDRPDYSNLIPGPPGGSFPVVRDGFGGGSMLVRPDDLRMFLRVVDQIQPGFMGSPQP
ncbi:BnaC04g26740D [Brassica napus]|uniref:(rape) hypothetical protein n=1 Tax=Brassica napus TaxID=3708 RepID=A0A078FJ16_BRANA|nr:unnamed protein product [Brassica napus]CDY13161.1 BnaC04g26740D [Brassica napus]